jgi:Transcriptional regulators
MVNTILLTIRSKMESASKAEKILGNYILENVQAIPALSVAELSRKSGVSQATVVRFAQNLGVDGFKGLKVELARCSMDDITNGLYDEIAPDDGIDELKDKLVIRTQHTLETTGKGLDKQILKETVDQLVAADVIQVYGLGASNLVAEDFTQKFSRIGTTVFNTQDTHLMTSNFLTQQHRQVILLISDSGETKETLTLARLAKKKHITVIGLTSDAKSSLAKLADIHILSSNNVPKDKIRSAATTSLISQLYVVELIYYLYLQRDYDNNVQKLKESHLLVDEFFSGKK